MDREKAIQILKRCEAESHCKHYKRHYCCIGCGQREALDLAIEALKGDLHCPKCGTIVRDGRQYHDLVYRGEAEQVTSKLKNPHDSLLKADSDECKEQKSKLDCISRQQAINAVENTDINITESEWDELINAIDNLPPVTPTVKVRQVDTLIIATALRDFAQDSERNISDRERAEELREQVLAYGASMCQPVTPTERTGEWTNTGVLTVHCSNCKSEFHELEAMNYCPNCGAKMGGDDNG